MEHTESILVGDLLEKWVVWIVQSGKVLVFIREVMGSNPIPSVCRLSLVVMWTLDKG